LSAALSAARGGASVLLVDEYAHGGGHSLGYHHESEIGSVRDDLVVKTLAHTLIEHMPQTTAQAFYPPKTLLVGPGGAVTPSRDPRSETESASETLVGLHRVNASAFIFATGAYDTIPLFDNSDTAGIFGSRAIRLFLERDGLKPGSRAVVYGTGRALGDLSHYLVRHKIDIAAVVDASAPPAGSGEDLPRGVRCFKNSRVDEANGGEWLSSVTVVESHANSDRSKKHVIPCDLLCIAFPGQGAYELAYQAGFKFEMSSDPLLENKVMLPSTSSTRSDNGVPFFVIGELAGQRAWRDKVIAGEDAGSRTAQPHQASEKD
jgi:sarcosine oxidase subunit alpha